MSLVSEKDIPRFENKRIVILGDLVADQFLHGTISRVSREAPVFILKHDETETRPGAAANAAANIASLGGIPLLIGLLGNDRNGELLRDALVSRNVSCELVCSSGESQTTKIRVLAGQHYAAKQQVIRIDYEPAGEANDQITKLLLKNLTDAIETADAVVISDYNYGVVTKLVADTAIELSKKKGVPVVVDSRFRLSDFAGAASATPNQDEVEQILGTGFTESDCVGLRERLELDALLITRGNEGMLLLEAGKDPRTLNAVGPKIPIDVTGAGDTVLAAYALGLASGLSYLESATIANHAGGLVVMKKGTAVATLDELRASLHENADLAATTNIK